MRQTSHEIHMNPAFTQKSCNFHLKLKSISCEPKNSTVLKKFSLEKFYFTFTSYIETFKTRKLRFGFIFKLIHNEVFFSSYLAYRNVNTNRKSSESWFLKFFMFILHWVSYLKPKFLESGRFVCIKNFKLYVHVFKVQFYVRAFKTCVQVFLSTILGVYIKTKMLCACV